MARSKNDQEASVRRRLHRHIGWYASEAQMDQSDRLVFAEEILGIDGLESYSDLNADQLDQILYGLKAWRTVQRIRHANGHLITEAKVILDRAQETAEKAAERQTEDDSWD